MNSYFQIFSWILCTFALLLEMIENHRLRKENKIQRELLTQADALFQRGLELFSRKPKEGEETNENKIKEKSAIQNESCH